MKECLHCKKEFEAKKETAKFCSTSCRVMFSRKNKRSKERTEEVSNKVILNKILGIVEKFGDNSPINYTPAIQKSFDGNRQDKLVNDEYGQWKEPELKKSEFYYLIKKRIEDADEGWELDSIGLDIKTTPMPFTEKKELEFLAVAKYKKIT